MSVALAGIDPPMRLSPEPALSIEEFWRFSVENPDYRMERTAEGEILIMSPTRRRSGFRNSQITRALGNWAEADGRGYEFDSSTGFNLPDGSVLSPDAAWTDGSKWTPAVEDSYNQTLVPDFIVELRSESDRLPDLREKMQRWMANGVQLAWLIDPKHKSVEIYRPGQQPEVQEGQRVVHGEGPVAGFVLELGRIWS